jgi:hypothetical protein
LSGVRPAGWIAALAIPLTPYPGAVAAACNVHAALMTNGVLYWVEAVVGTLPSVV